MFHIEISSDLDGLLADQDHWNGLTRGVPFRTTSWLAPWWDQFRNDKQAHVVVARDESRAIRGLLPLYRSTETSVRTLSMIGDGDACSDHVSVLAHEEDAVQVAEAIGRHLASTASDAELGWDVIDIDGVVEGDAPMTALAQGLKAGGASLYTQSRMSTWFKPCDASWAEHLKHHGKTQRRRMRRMSERIGEGGSHEKLVAATDEQVDQMLDALIELHQRRWIDAGETGSYSDPCFRQFIRAAAKEFCRRGQLYLNAIKHEGRIIASEMSVIGDNRILYCYSAGYDVDEAKLEPGRVIGIDTLQELYRQNLAGIDYMRGDEEYKKRLSTQSARLLRVRAIAPTWLPRLRHAAWRTQFELKQWMRRRSGRRTVHVLDITSSPQTDFSTSE